MKSNIKLLIAAALVCLFATSCDKEPCGPDKGPEEPTDFSGGCEAVDLGLSVKWASYNVGATKPEDAGHYFAWGETSGKENYVWAKEGDYKWGVYDSKALPKYGMTKYTAGVNGGDGHTTLDPADDAATKNWGTKWRTPTFEEMKELFDSNKCKWTLYSNGYLVTSLKNSNSIFLPAAGWYTGKGLDSRKGGAYYTSSVNEARLDNPYFIWFYHDTDMSKDVIYLDGRGGGRYLSFSVRAVTDF